MSKKSLIIAFITLSIIVGSLFLVRTTLGTVMGSKNLLSPVVGIADLPVQEPSGKCGYQFFLKKKGEGYQALPEDFIYQKKSDGTYDMSLFHMVNPEVPDDVQNALATSNIDDDNPETWKNRASNYEAWEKYKRDHRQADLTLVIYTDGCKAAVNKAIYYFKGGSKENTYSKPGGVSVIYRSSIKDIDTHILTSPVAKTMNCHVVPVTSDDGSTYYGVKNNLKESDLNEEQKRLYIQAQEDSESGGYDLHSLCGSVDGEQDSNGYYYRTNLTRYPEQNVFIKTFYNPDDVVSWNKTVVVQ